MAAVTLTGITKQFGQTAAVDGVDLSVGDGEFFSLLGPSGCGKSTLLNIVCGLLTPDGGMVRINGQNVNAQSPKERGVAMVFQDYALYPHMTVFENLGFPLRADKLRKAEISAKVAQAAESLGITEQLGRYPRELSGGQRQRVALGRALVRDPKVFLMDEPLSNLDARLRTQMRKELGLLQKRLGATVIYVTHDQVEAMTLSDRMAVMSGGQIQQVGPPIELYDHPTNRFVARFLGDIGMNLLRGSLVRDGGMPMWRSADLRWPLSPDQAVAARSLPADHPLDLGVHPEDVTVVERDGTQWASGELLLREQLGAEQHLHVQLPGHPIVARVGPHLRPEHADVLALALKHDAVHVFDAETGRALAAPTESTEPTEPVDDPDPVRAAELSSTSGQPGDRIEERSNG